ncbi:MAG: multidrug efflux system outer membrane protein [Hyphomicrobiaceae bacterium]
MQVTQTLHRLAVLLGEHAGALNAELAEAKPLPTLPESIALGIPAELLRRRPDIRRSERQLAAQTALVGAATAQLYPQFSLSGAFGAVAFDIDRLFVNRSRAFNVTPGVSLNIFDGGRVRGAINEEEARTQVARLNYDNTVLLAVEETENAIAMLRRLREQRDALQRVVTASGRSAELAEELYKQGLRSFQNVLDAQRTLSSAQDALATSEGSVVTSAITLYRALGGGWQPTAATGQETP